MVLSCLFLELCCLIIYYLYFIQKKNRIAVYSYLFKEGVLVAKKDGWAAQHSDAIPIPNLEVMCLLKSFKSKGFVKETFNWGYYYWYLTAEGVEYLRTYLALPEDIVPATLKQTALPTRPGFDAQGEKQSAGGFDRNNRERKNYRD